MNDISLDMRDVAAKVTVRCTHLGQVRWRVRLSTWLLELAQRISPLKLEICQDITTPALFYCPFCQKDVSTRTVAGRLEYPQCSHCGRQFPVKDGNVMAMSCTYGCHIVDEYGFVPTAGCPVHD